MPFLDHLEELRWRLVKALIAIAVGIAVGYGVVTHWDVIAFLKRPIDPFLPPGQQLLFLSLLDPFFLQLKLALAIGAVVALPVLLYQVWAFLQPALHRQEKRMVLPVLLAGLALFAVGAGLGFFVVMPVTIPILLKFATSSLQPMITASEYFSLTIGVVLAFGAVFEMPLVMFVLIWMRILSSAFLRRHHKTFIIVNAVASSILTPGDIIVMTLIVMVPIQLFYELAILMAIVLERRRARADAADAAEAAVAEPTGTPAAGPA
jgi:sec-independent protein translocase protein TatC